MPLTPHCQRSGAGVARPGIACVSTQVSPDGSEGDRVAAEHNGAIGSTDAWMEIQVQAKGPAAGDRPFCGWGNSCAVAPREAPERIKGIGTISVALVAHYTEYLLSDVSHVC